ncbi:MAG: WD40 repeat domain-containing protein [Chloroflexota bacterium]
MERQDNLLIAQYRGSLPRVQKRVSYMVLYGWFYLLLTCFLSGCSSDNHAVNTDPRLVSKFAVSGVYPRALAWSPDGKEIAVGMGNSPSVRLFSFPNGQQIASFGDYPVDTNGLAWSPNGQYLAGAILNPSNTLQVWNPVTTKSLVLTSAGSGGLGLAWSPDSKFLAVMSEGKRDAKNPTPNGGVALYETASWTQTFSMPTTSIITGAAWSPDGKRLAFAANTPRADNSDSTVLLLLDIADNHIEQIGEAQDGFSTIVSWASSGNLIAFELNTLDTKPGEVLIADITKKTLIQRIRGDLTVNTLSWSPLEERIAVAGFSRNMQVWEARTGRLVESYYHDSTTSDDIFQVSWSPDGRFIASLVSDNTLWFWHAPK